MQPEIAYGETKCAPNKEIAISPFLLTTVHFIITKNARQQRDEAVGMATIVL